MASHHQLRYQYALGQPYINLSAANNTNSHSDENHGLRLIWHLCQLCNVTTSTISVYLSLEALARETSANSNLNDSFVLYQPLMRAHTEMLRDVCRNLETNRDALLQTGLHVSCWTDASYRSLIDASNKIPFIIRTIPQTISPFLEAAKLNEHCMPNKAVVDEIREACDYVTELSVGNPSKGIVGLE